jgi:hypothetical protein
MTNTEFLAFLFVGFLSAIVFGIFLGIAMADKGRRRELIVAADNSKLEQVRRRAFERLNRAGSVNAAVRQQDILDAEVLD